MRDRTIVQGVISQLMAGGTCMIPDQMRILSVDFVDLYEKY